MKSHRYAVILIVVFMSLGVLPLVSASAPSGIGTPYLWADATGNPSVTQFIANGITDGGIPGNGAAAFTIWFTVPSNIGLADISSAAGQAWIDQNCGFATTLTAQPPIDGRNTFQLDGYCTGIAAGPRVIGNMVQVATVTFSAASCTANQSGFSVRPVADGENTSLFEPDGTPTIIPAERMWEGGGCGNPTAVTLSNVTASPVAPIANSLYLTAAAAVTLLGTIGLALRGIRKY